MGIFNTHKKDIASAYDAYADTLYRLALSHLQNPDDAQDAVQDVFIKYTCSAPNFSDSEHEQAWLIRVTVNHCLDLLRRKKVRAYTPLDELEDISDDSAVPNADTNDLLNKIYAIPEANRAAMILHYLMDYSVEKTAKTLNLSVSAIKMRLSRGREALKKLIEEENNVQ